MRIVRWPHPALRYVAKPVRHIDDTLRDHAAQMLELMYEQKGVALAATQVALPVRLFVCNLAADRNQPQHEFVAINPKIVTRKGSEEGEEGCLSFPRMYAKVRRARQVSVEAYDINGQPIKRSLVGLEGRLWQHEIDHLDGVVFIDHFSAMTKLARRGDVRSFEGQFRKSQESGGTPSDRELLSEMQALEERWIAAGRLADSLDYDEAPTVSLAPQRSDDGHSDSSTDGDPTT